MNETEDRLAATLADISKVAVAVSGGVDSMTLACFARRKLGGDRMLAVHATSPAVPAEATQRVMDLAAREDWTLQVITAGEFADPSYRANPVNRCFFCKTNLYGAIAGLTPHQILSGANLDDFGEYRPGLDAARDHGVRHPYVEARMNKAAVRALAQRLDLPEIADLPSAPCLSSRIETGIRIDPAVLRFVHAVERMVGDQLDANRAGRSIRCRIRALGVVVELDAASLEALQNIGTDALRRRILAMAPDELRSGGVAFAPYRIGSAFLIERAET